MEKLISIRRAVIVIILLLLTNAGLHAANTMQMGSASMGPLQPFTLQVSINNSSQFVAFQFDLPIPAGFSYVGNSAALNPSRSNGHILQAELISGNTLRVFGFSFNNTFFLGDTGTIVTFQLQSGTMPGEFPLNLVGPIIGDINQVNILTGSFNGIATVLAPDINITATLIDFDRTPLGQSTTRSFQIDNLGNQPLNILSITFDSPYFEVVGNSTFSIGAGQSANVIIRFNSVVKGFYNNMMTIASNDPDEIATTVNLQSHAYAVNELHAETLSVFSGQQGTLHLSINNMEPFTGFQFDLQLPAPMSYIIGSAALTNRKTDHVVSANMIAGNKLRVIAYSPTMKLFTGTEGDIVTVTFMIVGPGGYYPLDLSDVVIGNIEGENCLSDFYNGYLQIAAPDIECNGSLPFGDVSVLDTGHQNLQVNNQGNDTLKIHQVTFTNPVFSLATPLPLNILPYEAKNLRVDFHQPSEGQATGTMKIFSNDPEPYENPKPVSLSGYAFNPNYMIVPDLVCKNVDTIRIPVKVDNIEEFVGFQFDLNFPSILHYVPNSAVLSTRAQGHLLMEQILGPSAVRLISFSLSQLPFTGDTGTIATLTFTINTQDPSNTLLPLTLTNAILGNALSQNILYAVQNGNLSIVFSHAISGSLVYNNIYNTPLDSVWVFLSQNNIRKDSVLTQANGNYSFSNVSNGTYTLSAGNARPWAGVNGTDALKIMRFIIGWEPFSTFIRETAADVDNSSSVSAVDVLKVKKRFVGLDTTFARGDWTFEKQTGGNIVIMNDG
ncbi:MAG: choice-of-anchor D domain-containing protein, partial [Bacteroidales bacterium]|nr:choice-of-anchor D domain-containing protein [Bacteroidales bacterium]